MNMQTFQPTDEMIKEILKNHEKWLKNQEGGKRANLNCADLSGADLSGADLRGAYLIGACLIGADLSKANLCEANLCEADLSGADLRGAELSWTYMSGANLGCANLGCANLYRAELSRAYLKGANLQEASLREAILCGTILCDANMLGANMLGAYLCETDMRGTKNAPYIPTACPDSGSFVGWKKANGLIVKLEILEDARRSSSTGRKCRCDKAKVLAIEELDGSPSERTEVPSDKDKTFIYRVGEIVEESRFNADRFVECADGIHFFINRQEAVEY